MNDKSHLHHIQRGIILSLAAHSPLKFTELQPPRVANNTFSYHLKRLVDSGYVQATNSGYVPTRKALKLTAVATTQTSKITAPALLTMLYITNDNGEVLLINRDTNPFSGWYGLPSGMIHTGESLEEAARRELVEKTTIQSADKPELAGVLDFQYIESTTSDVFVHAVAFIYKINYGGDSSELNDKKIGYGQLSWSTFKRQHILPEVLAAKEIVDNPSLFHKSISLEEPKHVLSV